MAVAAARDMCNNIIDTSSRGARLTAFLAVEKQAPLRLIETKV